MNLGDGVGREPAPDVATYTYAGMGYANPHALTQLSSGYSTSTFVYDNDGNVAQKTTDGTTTTYIWDYANRLTALGSGGATTTYGYDAFGTRVYQIVATTSTTTYPFKFFSVASTTKSSNNFATSTEYVFNGDTLLATVDQGFKNGSATGTAQTRYIHPDHLGSTNVVTNESGAVVQTLDYYPFGATRVSVSTSTNEKRQFIGQFRDESGLDYLQARYYSNDRGQFISQDPTFWAKQKLEDPQTLNSYSYASDNPVTSKDPKGDTAYYFDNGQITFTQPYFNNVKYTESQQRQMVNNNAALMVNHRLDPFFFKDQVQNGGPMDYKNAPDSNRLYFMNGGLVKSEVFGNYNYGYAGSAAGFGPNILTDMAGLYGIYRWGKPGAASPQLSNVFNNFDQRNDSMYIQQGVNDYLKSNPSSPSAGASSASNGAYVQSGAQNVSRVAATIAVTLQAIRVAIAFLATYTGK